MTTAADWVLDALAVEGVTHLFGNPGSTELPLVDALAHTDVPEFVLGLHEAAVVGMADGFSQSTGRLVAVNLHVTPGLANGLSGILNARRARVPMIVTVGAQDTSLAHADPFLGGDIVGMAAPVAKWAVEPATVDALPETLAHAVVVACTPPCGPVVVSLPVDVQSAPAPPTPYVRPAPDALPPVPAGVVEAAVRLLAAARAPCVIAGDGVAHRDAGAAVARLAERLGAPVWGEPHAARAPVPWNHALWRGYLPPLGTDIRAALDGHDVVLVVGAPVFRVFGPSRGPLLPPGAALIHVDADPADIGRVVAPVAGVAADVLGFVCALEAGLPPGPGAAGRTTRVVAENAARRHRARRAPRGGDGITPQRLADAVAAAVRPGDLVVDESLTSGRAVRRARFGRPRNWLGHRGSALGWGLPATVGASLAHPRRFCLCLQGDGGLVFGVPALWTAAQHGCRVGLVVADNGGYEILRAGLRTLTGCADTRWPGVDVPGLDTAGLCAAYGASVERVADPAALGRALADLRERAADGPAVLVARVTPTAA